MIPLKLTLEGIYSYQERQTIDFTALSQAGLFGIFGAVGSGKSSILEAITYALFGETERLNARDKRAYNMMNLKSNRSYIELDFVNFEDRTFRITREFKRNSKNFDDVKSPTVVLYEKINEEWVPLESSNTQHIIGLSYENFKRTIIIPQGQFKEFIELGAKERTDMMKEIFQLHRFDLQDKVSNLYKKNQSELDHLNGQLIGFDEVTSEQIETTETNLQLAVESFVAIESSYKSHHEKFLRLKKLKEDVLELRTVKALFQQLLEQKGEKETLRLKLNRFEEAQTNFLHILKSKEKLAQEGLIAHKRVETEKQRQAEIQQLMQEHSSNLNLLKSQYELLPQRRVQELDLELISQLITFSNEIKSLQDRAQKGRNFVEETRAQQRHFKAKIQETEIQIASLKQSKPSAHELMELGQWYTKQQGIQQQEDDLNKQAIDLETSIAVLKQELQAIHPDLEKFRSNHLLVASALEQKLQSLQDEKSHLLLQQRLTQYAENLKAGSPCPLCGALEHPAINQGQDISQEVAANEKLIAEANESLKHQQDQQFQVEKLQLRLQSLNDQQQDLNTKIQLNANNKIVHAQQFTWIGYSATDESSYTSNKQELARIETQITTVEQQLGEHQATLASVEEKLEKYNKALHQFERDEASKQAQINQNMGNLKALRWSDYEMRESEAVEKEYTALKRSNLEIERDYITLSERLNELNSQFAAQNSLVQTIVEQLADIRRESQETDATIQQLLVASPFETLAEIQQILAENLSVIQIRQELEQFQIQFETVKAQISQSEKKLVDQVYDENEFLAQEKILDESAQQLKASTESVARLQQERDQLKIAYAKKENLLQQQVKLNLRQDNLKQLFNLFKGAGFVQYVSSIYLRQLCDHANIRFHRMTRNQLSLQLNDNNEFEIIDYLNEGKSRSVKTLSGGQAFQVSLSLALALAESVQSNSRAAKNFFFIDEGFGTQDITSVNIVFETLLDLHKENRIVGIISHVEELKERIPVSLSIEKDEEQGSQIFIN
ncbi:SbcC/MukB-like Walker B domain-containing protein [Sphingobacterium siyangense]|uniref:SbcC/MukB-like Walker B domain-containing protein n=1 Tax=Sphingobacterium siyangense TaxID=459529 RepID=UPI001964200C|nr:SMC family ATPase [Sphingobacterium siyangense]QRY55676.1 SMC family ATPase [Sphingobacterium siyangense]